MAEPSPLNRLHPAVRRWMGSQGWTGLRPVQAAAVEPILAGDRDVVIAAATAAGKTEAAFLPIATRLIEDPQPSIQALFVSPLKALINDQHRRMQQIAHGLGFPVSRWHGDVGGSAKRALLEDPAGVLLITPESLEAFFVLRGRELRRLFAGLRYVVIDELHAFLLGERGRQLQALLRRLELDLGRSIPRIGLSATLGDMRVAQRFVRSDAPDRVEVVRAEPGGLRLELGLFAGVDPPDDDSLQADSEQLTFGERWIAEHLFEHLRGAANLAFANRRRDVELYAARLAELCDERGVPQEFFPHHGSLARELREDVEARLVADARPTTALCTSTLELGIDLGDIQSVAQLGAPPSVAALRQRLGRAGRRGGTAVLRVYVHASTPHHEAPPIDQLHEELVRAIAMIDLCLEGWCEPRDDHALHYSTLVQQVLSLVAQHHGVQAATIYQTLCADGPFEGVSAEELGELLRELGRREVLMQDPRGLLLPGVVGERLLNQHTFYAAFTTPVEYRVVAGSHTLGNLPLQMPYAPGVGLVFAGRRWTVVNIDEVRRVLEVRPGLQGAPPTFGGGGGGLHGVVRARQREVLAGTDVPAYLDENTQRLLAAARARYVDLGLDAARLIEHRGDVWIWPWCDDRARAALVLALAAAGCHPTAQGPAIVLENCGVDEAFARLGDLQSDGPPDPLELVRSAPLPRRGKYDEFLGDELLARDHAARALDCEAAWAALDELLAPRDTQSS